MASVPNCCATCPHHTEIRNPKSEIQNLRPIPDAPPATIKDLCVITSYFNPQGYRRPRQNYHRFAAAIAAAGLDLWTVELAFDDDDFELPEASLQLRGTRQANLMFQKERLLNRLIELLPADYDAIAWIDADVLFLNPNWPAEASAELGRRQVVQLFDDSYHLLPGGRLEKIRPSTAWHWQHQPDDPNFGQFDLHHPGFAWAARADWLRTHGLHDSMISGQGDCLMSMAFSSLSSVLKPQLSQPGVLRLLNNPWRARFEDWALPAGRAVGGSIGHVRGALLHLYHGSFANRRYRERWRYLVENGFNPGEHLEIDSNGLWAWTDAARAQKPKMIEAVARNFAIRKEDD